VVLRREAKLSVSMAEHPEISTSVSTGVQVKICGLTNLADAQAAVDAGATLLGFIFYEESPRFVTIATVADIVAKLRGPSPNHQSPVTNHQLPITDHQLPITNHQSPTHSAALRDLVTRSPLLVGVFVNPSLEQVGTTMDTCALDLAQLHGEESPELLALLHRRGYKALRPRTQAEAESQAKRYVKYGPGCGPQLLVDAYHPAARGGTGQMGDWTLAARLARSYRLLLAGGLTPANVAAAVAQVHPWGVDVSSGVEAAPGRKDHAAIHAFVAAATEARA